MSANSEKPDLDSGKQDESENADESDFSSSENNNFTALQNILNSLKLESYFKAFKDEEIDDNFLKEIDLSNAEEWNQVSTLLPTIGARGKLKKSLLEFQVSAMFCTSLYMKGVLEHSVVLFFILVGCEFEFIQLCD